MKISDFENTTPLFLPERFLVGPLEGWGIMERITGGLQQRFAVQAEGSWEAETMTLHFVETWTFDNGHVDTLRWQIRPGEDGEYTGHEDRLDGEAEGEQAGCAFHWRYTRDVPQPDGSSTKLNFDDWFYRIDENAVFVKGTAGRLGVPFASAHVCYRRRQE